MSFWTVKRYHDGCVACSIFAGVPRPMLKEPSRSMLLRVGCKDIASLVRLSVCTSHPTLGFACAPGANTSRNEEWTVCNDCKENRWEKSQLISQTLVNTHVQVKDLFEACEVTRWVSVSNVFASVSAAVFTSK